ncbi:MAG TPA: HAD-IA family hydrolase [Longimicrobiaceae bacterium]|nr:HAD-IA family hydrolase [Longimicrobiaceae bacterium]
MSTSQIKAVLYDFDGTLADSTALIMQCWRHMMNTHHGACPPDEEWLSGFGMTLETQVRRFARGDAEYEAMLGSYREHQVAHYAGMLRPFPGTVETVAELARRGFGLAIVTSRLRHTTLEGMDLCGLTDLFPVIVTPEDVAEPKPRPEPVLFALDRLGVQPHEAIFIGDSPHDMAAGKAAGTRTAAALWGPFPRATLAAESPDVFLDLPDDILRLLGNPPLARAR